MIDPKSIVALKVYPPLGIARVGNAAGVDDYVIGPEVIGGPASLPALQSGEEERPALYAEDFRAANGAIKRQAARFRVYAHMREGTVREITAENARIEWRVSIANLKAGWYEFNQAMDLPCLGQNAARRNARLIDPENRNRLDITPTPRSIEGPNAGPVAFGDGAFWGREVYLGEARTDSAGRLIFLGGKGLSRPFRSNVAPLTFANNDGWHDDVADGPVRATVTFPGEAPMTAEPGYVAVTPPNYAPGLFGLVTADDAVREVFHQQGWIAAPTATSFTRDIWPIFDRLTGLQWVNHGLFIAHGFGSPLDARSPEAIVRLADGSAANTPWRAAVFALFRDPCLGGVLDEPKIPQIFGDGVDTLWDPVKTATALLAVTRTQYTHLRRWSEGSFASDWPGAAPRPPAFGSLDGAAQVAQLERAGLHDCLGGPFHPAMELTWVIRIPHLWKGAYRLKIPLDDAPARQDWGAKLTPEVCTGAGGPYDGAAAGSLTRFLGVPWQTDHTSCNSASDYFPSTFLSMPTFWGPRAPDQVLAEGNYLRAAAISQGAAETPVQAQKHLMHRVDWLRDIRGRDYYERLSKMVAEWAELGMVLPVRESVAGLPDTDVRVEQGRAETKDGVTTLIDVERDPKFQLMREIEDLVQPPGARALGAAPAVKKAVALPPKRSYRPGEI